MHHWMTSSITQRPNILKISEHEPGTSLIADIFAFHTYYFQESDPYSVNYAHKDGYNIAYIDGSARFYLESGYDIASQQVWGHNNAELAIWTDYFDEDY